MATRLDLNARLDPESLRARFSQDDFNAILRDAGLRSVPGSRSGSPVRKMGVLKEARTREERKDM